MNLPRIRYDEFEDKKEISNPIVCNSCIVRVIIDTYKLEYKVRIQPENKVIYSCTGSNDGYPFNDLIKLKRHVKKYLKEILGAAFYEEIRKNR